MKPDKISHFVLMGEKLPTSDQVVKKGKSSTNDYPWTAAISTKIADDFMVGELKTVDGMIPTDIAEDLKDCDSRVEKLVRRGYFLKEGRSIRYQGQELVRSYDERVLRTHDNGWFNRMLNRLNVSALAEQRHKLLADDYAHELSKKHKAETIVVEWSGTVVLNTQSSKEDITNAVADRIENIRQLMRHGYRHFVLFNMPDLSLMPSYKSKSQIERDKVREYTQEFNAQLQKACQELSSKFNGSIEVFDVAKVYREGLNEVSSMDQIEDLVAGRFYEKYKSHYNFQPPIERAEKDNVSDLSDETQLVAAFRTAYNKMLDGNRHSFFGRNRVSRVEVKDERLSLDGILMHALHNGGVRSLQVMKDLHWIDAKGNLYLNNKVLKESFERVQAAIAQASEERRHAPI